MDKRPTGRNAALGLSTRAIHHGYDPAEEHGALTPPIFMTSTYAFESEEAGSELFLGERAGYISEVPRETHVYIVPHGYDMHMGGAGEPAAPPSRLRS